MTLLQRPTAVADLMTMEPVVIGADARLEEAEELMRRHHVSGLPVADRSGRLVGVISQTDFLYLADPQTRSLIRLAPDQVRVAEVMSRPPVTVLLSTSLVEAARVMRRERVHRVVVVDSQQRPLGVLSALDYVDLYAEG
ncbi:MAG: CBS domain-containing protein [Chloroflexota bacterium]|nr:CBS domain-containing protein [Chloroflexota bacterium]